MSAYLNWRLLLGELEVAAGEVLYQTIASRASLEQMRRWALDLRATLEQRLAPAAGGP